MVITKTLSATEQGARRHEGFEERFLAVCRAVAGGDGEQLVDVFITPDGPVASKAGDFVIDDEAWARIDRAFKDRNLPMVIDYEHQTLGGQFAAPSGKAPAAGWIVAIRRDKGRGIIASVEWTEDARAEIRAGQYRFISPVMRIRRADGAVEALHSAGLTNNPAITERMERLAASARDTDKEIRAMAEQPENTGGDPGVIIGQILAKLDITDVEAGASLIDTLQAILAKVSAGTGDGGEKETDGESEAVASSVRTVLKLSDDANAETVKTALETIVHKAATGGDVQKQLAVMQEELRVGKRDAFMAPFIEKGVLNPTDDKDFHAIVCRAYDHDPKDARVLLEQRVNALPPGGRVVDPADKAAASGGREAVIAHARKDFAAGGTEHRLTDEKSFVELALSDAKLGPLTETEATRLVA